MRLSFSFLKILIGVGFFSLFIQSFVLQKDLNLKEDYQNHIYKTKIIRPERGLILDRDGKVLADNRLRIDLKLQEGVVLDNFHKDPDGWHVDVDFETFKKLKVNSQVVDVRERLARYYPYGRLFSLILGYTRRIDPQDHVALEEYGYGMNERIGATGIEMVYETTLRGDYGSVFFRDLPSSYYEDEILNQENAQKGDDIHLSLSLPIQKLSWDILENNEGGSNGVVIVGNPITGELYSMVSRPSYSPEGYMSSRWEDIPGVGQKSELFNRATEGLYPPASTFKVVSAAAALEYMGIDPSRRYNCNGAVRVGNTIFKGWKKEGLGVLDMVDSLAHSCNETFYYLGMEVPGWNKDPKILQDTAYQFGFGSKVGLPIPESKGLIPDNEWKKRNFGEPWYGGDTVNMMIGQGSLLVTPIQVYSAYQALANGSRISPILISKIGDNIQDKNYLDFHFSDKTLGTIRKGLDFAVSEGTAIRTLIDDDWSIVEGVTMSAKTGTAQTGNSQLPPHGWFVGYGEIKVSEKKIEPILVLILAEHAGMSSKSVVPKARQLIKNIRDYWRLELED